MKTITKITSLFYRILSKFEKRVVDDGSGIKEFEWQLENEHQILINTKAIGDPQYKINSRHNINLPIKGGWGYAKDSACILKIDRSVITTQSISIPEIEHTFIECRCVEEMIEAERLIGHEIILKENNNKNKIKNLRWVLIEHKFFSENNKRYDYYKFHIELMNIFYYFSSESKLSKKNKIQDIWKINKGRIRKIQRECYFDVTLKNK